MRPLELLQFARPIITREGLAAIQLDRRAFNALKKDIEATMLSGMHRDSGLWMVPKDSMRYNGTLYVVEP